MWLRFLSHTTHHMPWTSTCELQPWCDVAVLFLAISCTLSAINIVSWSKQLYMLNNFGGLTWLSPCLTCNSGLKLVYLDIALWCFAKVGWVGHLISATQKRHKTILHIEEHWSWSIVSCCLFVSCAEVCFPDFDPPVTSLQFPHAFPSNDPLILLFLQQIDWDWGIQLLNCSASCKWLGYGHHTSIW